MYLFYEFLEFLQQIVSFAGQSVDYTIPIPSCGVDTKIIENGRHYLIFFTSELEKTSLTIKFLYLFD